MATDVMQVHAKGESRVLTIARTQFDPAIHTPVDPQEVVAVPIDSRPAGSNQMTDAEVANFRDQNKEATADLQPRAVVSTPSSRPAQPSTMANEHPENVRQVQSIRRPVTTNARHPTAKRKSA